jgi:hypothetical protein
MYVCERGCIYVYIYIYNICARANKMFYVYSYALYKLLYVYDVRHSHALSRTHPHIHIRIYIYTHTCTYTHQYVIPFAVSACCLNSASFAFALAHAVSESRALCSAFNLSFFSSSNVDRLCTISFSMCSRSSTTPRSAGPATRSATFPITCKRCLYVCVYVYICVCVHARIYVYVDAYLHACAWFPKFTHDTRVPCRSGCVDVSRAKFRHLRIAVLER